MEEINQTVEVQDNPINIANQTLCQNDRWNEHFQKENIFEKILIKQPPIKQQKKQVETKLFLAYGGTFFFLGITIWFVVWGSQQLNALKSYMFALNSTYAASICIAVMYRLVPTWREVFRVFFLMDSIFLAMILAGFAFFYQIVFVTEVTWDIYLMMPFYCLHVFCAVSSLKLILLYMKWQKWRLILMKSLMIYLGASFFSFGIYYIITRKTYFQIKDQKTKQNFNNASALLVFAQFSYFCEVLNKFCDFDGTNLLRYDYHIKHINQQKLKARKSFIEQKRNTIKSLINFRQLFLQHSIQKNINKRTQIRSLTQDLKRIKLHKDYQILQKIKPTNSINPPQNDIFSKRILFKNKTVLQNKITHQ